MQKDTHPCQTLVLAVLFLRQFSNQLVFRQKIFREHNAIWAIFLCQVLFFLGLYMVVYYGKIRVVSKGGCRHVS